MTVYLLELTAYDDTVSPPVTRTLRFASEGYNTEPSDTPASTHFEPRLKNPANYSRSLFGGDGTTQGGQTVGFGEIVLIGNDGGLDYLRDYGIDGRALTIYTLESKTSAWSTRKTYLRGTVEQVTFSWRFVTLRLRDRLAELSQKQIQETTYAGTTTSGGATVEGNGDYEGKPKPRVYGLVRNVTPAVANAYDLIYQVNDGAVNSIDAVYANGVALTYGGTNHASVAALQGAAIAAGQYHTATTLGLFRLGGSPGGLVTADVTQGANAAARTAAQIVKAILTGPAGLSGSDYDDATFTALDTANASVCGIYIDTPRDILSVCSDVLNSIGGWLMPTRAGVFEVGRFEAPATSVATFGQNLILDRGGQRLQRLPTGDQGRGVPSWRVTLKHTRNWTPLSAGQLAGAVTAANAGFFNNEWRDEVASDSAVRTKHLLATALEFQTLLTSAANAATEATRRLNLYKAERDRFLVPVKSEYAVDLNVGDTITVQVDRYGMNSGRDFVIIGMTENAESGVTELDVWG